jgi:quinoprotein glucose dehydrogenase
MPCERLFCPGGGKLAFAVVLSMACHAQSALRPTAEHSNVVKGGEWGYYGGDPGGSRFSSLTQINRTNVQQLKVAWIYHTGDVSDGAQHPRRSGFETTPIMVDGTLYFSTAFNRVIALDPETGVERWSYDPHIDLNTRRV